jgi:hypothetical protein
MATWKAFPNARWPYEPDLARCARDLLPYQRPPKLSVQVQVGESFAEKLEEVIQRRLARPAKVIEHAEAKGTFKRKV